MPAIPTSQSRAPRPTSAASTPRRKRASSGRRPTNDPEGGTGGCSRFDPMARVPTSPPLLHSRRYAGPWHRYGLVLPGSPPRDRIEPVDPIASPPHARDAPHALSRLTTAPFLGRNALLSALRVHLEQAARGQGRGILLLGEPGIGKTRCADEVARAAAALGMQVHLARCHETEGAPGLWPWVQLAEALCAGRDEGALREILEPDLVALAPLLPAEARRLGATAPGSSAPESEVRYRLFEALTGMLRRAAEQRPLLLVIDDLQWADPASVLLARFVLREVRQAPIALLCLYRDSEILSEHPLAQPLADLATEAAAFRLDGLEEEDVARFMQHVAGFEVADVLAGAVHAQTGGNPLFLVEVVRLLATEDRLGGPGAPTPASAPLPSTVRHTIQRRVASLHPNTRRVLQSATVIGTEFDREILRAHRPRRPRRAHARARRSLRGAHPPPCGGGNRALSLRSRPDPRGDLRVALRGPSARGCIAQSARRSSPSARPISGRTSQSSRITS